MPFNQNKDADAEDDLIRTKTVAIIQTTNDYDKTRNKIKETFTIQNRSKNGDGITYTQISEYKTDLKRRLNKGEEEESTIKVHESIVLSKVNDDQFIDGSNILTTDCNCESAIESLIAKSEPCLEQGQLVVSDPNIYFKNETILKNNRKNLTFSTVELTQVLHNTTTVAEFPFDAENDIFSYNRF